MNLTIITLIIYMAIMFIVAWYFSRKESIETYFVNKRKTNIWLMTFSTVATVVGAGAVVAVVSEVYNTGISYGIALPISFIIGMLIWGFLAKKIKRIGDEYNAYTIVDFFEKRFDKKNKILVGTLQLFLLVVWIGVQAIAITSLASVLTGIDYQIALILTAVVTILYTAIGGLKVDIITDFIQFWIISVVFIIMAIAGYHHVGGWENLVSKIPAGHFDLFAFGGVSWFIGMILVSGFIYLGNTIHWQRVFSADSEETAMKSFFWSIPIMAVLSLIVVFLGLIATILLPEIPKETAIFALMNKILPSWLVGAGFASILAVIMSSVDSLLVGGSTIIYSAIFRNRNTESKNKLLYARILTGIFGLLGFVLAFLIPNIVTLSLFVSYMVLIFVPPILAALFLKKISANASFYSILIPFIALLILTPILKSNVFIVTVLLGVLIITLYDKLFKNKVVKNL